MDGSLLRVTISAARWRPLKGVSLALVDRQERSSGWVLVPLGQDVRSGEGD
jgi:hypothetical protein